VAPHAITFELRGQRQQRLWIDASRHAAGLFLVGRARSAPIEESDVERLPGRDRQALLHLRKHVAGRSVASLDRPPGRRALVLDLGGPLLVLRLSGTPALSLVVDDVVLATVGEGAAAWPLPAPRADAPPPDAPLLALPAPLEECRDRDLAETGCVRFVEARGGAGFVLASASWLEAASLYLVARRRGERFHALLRRALHENAREIRRLERLGANLAEDMAGLPEPEALRHQAEAILAAPDAVESGAVEASVPDPYHQDGSIRVSLDPRLSAPANADRLFGKARRIDRARAQVSQRLAETRRALEEARAAQRRTNAAENASDFEARTENGEARDRGGGGPPRHYLSAHGLSILVGRGARQNHHLTFDVARPEDVWLHARDVPGAHVIMRDPEGRAGAEDLREAAEVAAYFSDARLESGVDVHVTRRKHVRPAKGGPGRVFVHHSDTLRVTPKDPEGRLRRR